MPGSPRRSRSRNSRVSIPEPPTITAAPRALRGLPRASDAGRHRIDREELGIFTEKSVIVDVFEATCRVFRSVSPSDAI